MHFTTALHACLHSHAKRCLNRKSERSPSFILEPSSQVAKTAACKFTRTASHNSWLGPRTTTRRHRLTTYEWGVAAGAAVHPKSTYCGKPLCYGFCVRTPASGRKKMIYILTGCLNLFFFSRSGYSSSQMDMR